MSQSKDQANSALEKNKKAETEENYGFIKEERVPQRKWTKRMRILRTFLLVIACGVLFGIIARSSYGISDYIIRRFFSEEREPVTLRPTPSMEITPGGETPPVIDVKALQNYENIILGVKKAADALNPSLTTVTYAKDVVDPVFSDITESVVKVSGVVISKENNEFLIYTSHSKMKSVEYDRIYVTFYGGRKERAYVFAAAPEADVLLLSVSYKDFQNYEIENIKEIKFGHSSEMEAGSAVIAVGFPNGREPSVDMGMITGNSQKIYIRDNSLELMETNIYGGRGESGILVNTNGELVGMITTQYKLDRGRIEAIGIDKLYQMLTFMVNKAPYPKFGAIFRDIEDDVLKDISLQNGIIIDEVYDGSVAQVQQFRQGDIITELGGEPVTSVEEFFHLFTSYEKGDEMKITYYRNGKKFEKKWKVNF